MKKIIVIILAIFGAVNLYAATPGAYIGGGLGLSNLNVPTSYSRTGIFGPTTDSLGLAGRLFGGYNFNPYVGLELSLANYAQATDDQDNPNYKSNYIALNLVGKVYLPIFDTGLNLYGLGGGAFVHNTNKYHVDNTTEVIFVNNQAIAIGSSYTQTSTQNQLRPILGLGLSYDINSHFTTNLEYSRIQGTGNKSLSDIPNADLVTLNLSYNFG